MPQKLNLVGQRFGKLQVLREGGRTKAGAVKWVCACDCGKIKEIRGQALTQRRSHSCGCLSREQKTEICKSRATHGLAKTRVWTVWVNMKQRCQNPNATKYDQYGGRGITVCECWQAFENFIADMGQPPTRRHTIERKDANGNYEPGNCRWATQREQQNNRTNNRLIAAFGKNQTLLQWVSETGMSHKTITGRLKRGWPAERALSIAPRRGRNQYSNVA